MLTIVQDFHRKVKSLHVGMHRIRKKCEKVARTNLVRMDRNVIYEGQLFESLQADQRSQGKDLIIEIHTLIEQEVNTMHRQFTEGSEDVQREWTTHVKKIDSMVLGSLMRCIRSSLRDFSQAVDAQQHSGEAQPIFTTRAELQNGKVDCRPSLISITNSVNTIAKETVAVAKVVCKLSEKGLPSSESDSFYDIISSDETVLDRIVQIMNGMSTCAREARDSLVEWEKYRSLWDMDKNSFLRRYSKSSRQAYHEDIVKFKLQQASVESEKAACSLNFIQVHFASLRTELSTHALEFQDGLLNLLKKSTSAQIESLHKFIGVSISRLNEPVQSISDLAGIIDLLKVVKVKCDEAEKEFEPLINAQSTLERFDKSSINSESIGRLADLKPAFSSLLQCIEEVSTVVATSKVEMKNDFQHTALLFSNTKSQFCSNVNRIVTLGGLKTLPEAIEFVNSLKSDSVSNKEVEQQLQQGLDLFEIDLIDIKGLPRAECLVRTMDQTVTLFQSWDEIRQKWMRTPFDRLDCDEMSNEVSQVIKEMLKMDRDIRSWSFWTNLQERIDEFKECIPLVVAMINDGMRERHWHALQKAIEKTFHFRREEFTLGKAFALGLQNHAVLIADISATASKELTVERSLDDMETRLADFVIESCPHKDSFKMCPPEELFSMLEDDIITASAIKASSIGKTFLSRLKDVERSLNEALEFFEMFLLVQRQWLYLENIFMGTGDIGVQLPDECERFALVYHQFKDVNVLLRREQNVKAIILCSEINMTNLTSIHSKMEDIQSSLNEYLESKRRGFPRFYFVSDDDLLDMIGKASQPQSIQKYVKKCFEGIDTLLLENDDKNTWMITGGKASDEESIEFGQSVAVEGPIEEWMQNVLNKKRTSMLKLLEECCSDLKVTKQNEWVPKWQGQLLITSGAIAWTKRCERALELITSGKDKHSLRSVRKRQVSFLRHLTEMVRSGDIDDTNRSKVVALITTEIHNRDVIEKMLRSCCQDPDDFIWRSQLRFYFSSGICEIQQNNYDLPFGYEYQGNNGRLVVTPLTDRCVLTLLTALSLHRGGNPLGPAGTGKTETVKDLSKNLAYYCVVTNCSENMDYKSLGRIFSGLCQSGSWGCFDEFNRIKIEVISVAAMQISSILNAQRCKLNSFELMGIDTPCSPHAGIFITMNPGYAGRTELPDNLKALLRPVAMMAPDLVLIAEVILAAEGFTSGRGIAKKTISLYRLMEQQLSKQAHYDFGLRNIKAVLTMAGSLKREGSITDEALIIIRALIGLNAPRFIASDQDLFQLLLVDLFPDKNLDQLPDTSLTVAIRKVLVSKRLHADASLISKTIQLADSQKTRHSNMLIGKTMTGKSTIWQSLSIAKSMLDPSHLNFSPSVKTHILNPKALSISELYGSYDMVTFEWADGVLSSIFKTCAESDDQSGEHWIVLDGPVDALWIESMNSVMDDSKLLTLINGDRVSMTESMSLVFEVEDLSVASPATVSRAGMIYVDCDFVWKPFINKWIDGRSDILNSEKESFVELCEKVSLAYVPIVQLFESFLILCIDPNQSILDLQYHSRMNSVLNLYH